MRRAYSVWSVLTAIGAAGCAVVMIGQIFSLKRGGPTDHAFVLAALVLMMALAFYLIWLEYRDTRLLWLAALPVAAAFLIRALCLDYASGDYNSFLAHWVEFFRQNGGFFAISQDIGDYNVVYLYFVAAISYLDVPDLYLYKLFSILFDVLPAGAQEGLGASGSVFDSAVPAYGGAKRGLLGTMRQYLWGDGSPRSGSIAGGSAKKFRGAHGSGLFLQIAGYFCAASVGRNVAGQEGEVLASLVIPGDLYGHDPARPPVGKASVGYFEGIFRSDGGVFQPDP